MMNDESGDATSIDAITILTEFERKATKGVRVRAGHDISLLETLLKDVERYQRGGLSVEKGFVAQARYIGEKVYSYVTGKNICKTPTQRAIAKRKKSLESIQEDNKRLTEAVQSNDAYLAAEENRIYSELQTKVSRLASLDNELTQKKNAIVKVKDSLAGNKLNKQQQASSRQYLSAEEQHIKQIVSEMSSLTDYITLMNASYEQIIIERSQETTLGLFNELHESVLEHNMMLLDIYANREASGSHEYNIMKRVYEMTQVSNLKDAINQRRSDEAKRFANITPTPLYEQHENTLAQAQETLDTLRDLKNKV